MTYKERKFRAQARSGPHNRAAQERARQSLTPADPSKIAPVSGKNETHPILQEYPLTPAENLIVALVAKTNLLLTHLKREPNDSSARGRLDQIDEEIGL